MSYAIPTNELTLTDIKTYKQNAVDAGIKRALALGIARSINELVAREALPATDFGAPAGSGYAAERYITGALAASAWGSVFGTGVAPTMANNKVAVFYKLGDSAATPAVAGVRFMVGATGATTKAVFHIQLPLDNKLESDVYLSEPVVYDPQDVLFIQCYPRVAIAVGEELSFGAFIIERLGATVS